MGTGAFNNALVEPSANGARQCLYYGQKRPLMNCLLSLFAVLAVSAGFEAGMVYAVRVWNLPLERSTVYLQDFSLPTMQTIMHPWNSLVYLPLL